jgi:hypothetical protein
VTSSTVLDQLIDGPRKAAVYNRHDHAAPSVVLWTDGERLWSKVIPLLRDAMPELLVLTPEITDERTGGLLGIAVNFYHFGQPLGRGG